MIFPTCLKAWLRLCLLALALIPAYLGEMAIYDHPGWAGTGYVCGFLMAFTVAAWRREPKRVFVYPPHDPHLRYRIWCVFPALLFGFGSYYTNLSERLSNRTEVLLWLTALAFCVVPFWIKRSRLDTGLACSEDFPTWRIRLALWLRSLTTARWWEFAACSGIFIVAFTFRFAYLERYPLMYHNDEANCGIQALNIVKEWHKGAVNWFRPRDFYYFPTLGFLPSALSQALFSPNQFAHRLANVAFSMVALACFYSLLRNFLGRSGALLGAGLAATAHYTVHFSRSGIHSGHAGFMAVICAWVLWRALSTGRARWFVILGMALTMCLLTYHAAFLTPVWLALVLIVFLLVSPAFRKRYLGSLFLAFISAIIFYAPMFAEYQRAPHTFLSRSGSMVFGGDEYSVGKMKAKFGEDYLPAVLKHNAGRALTLFSKTETTNLQYGFRCGGMLEDTTSAVLVLGLGVAAARILWFTHWPLVLGILLNILFGVVLTTNSPEFSRIAGLMFLVHFLPALWGRELYCSAREAAGRRGGIIAAFMLVTGLVYIGYTNFDLYFNQHDKKMGRGNELYRTLIMLDARDGGPANYTYVYANTFPTDFQHRSHLFIADGHKTESFTKVSWLDYPLDANITSITFIIPKDDENLLSQLQDRFPGGDLRERHLIHREPSHIYNRYVVTRTKRDWAAIPQNNDFKPLRILEFNPQDRNKAFGYGPVEGFDLAEVHMAGFPADAGSDGKGVLVVAEPGEGIVLFASTSSEVDLGSRTAVIRVLIGATQPDAQVALVALNSPVDGQSAYLLACGRAVPVGRMRELLLIYRPPSNRLKPLVQVVVPKEAKKHVEIRIDNLSVEPLADFSKNKTLIRLEPPGTFNEGLDELQTNVNDVNGQVQIVDVQGNTKIHLSIKPDNDAANIGLYARRLLPPASVWIKTQFSNVVGMEGMTYVVLTNGEETLGISELNSMRGNKIRNLEFGGSIESRGSVPPFLVIQNAGPGVESTLEVDDCVIEQIQLNQ